MNKGFYIHIPFCIRKCKYCDFVSFSKDSGFAGEYFKALFLEAKKFYGENIDSVFIGGGTPSCVDAKLICTLMDNIRQNFNLLKNAEISIETNPSSVTEEKLSLYLKSGINRISMGVQSFCDRELLALGRLHDAREAYEKAEIAKKAGFKNINIDIMLSTPYQTLDSAKNTVETALSLSPEHISAYSLIIEEGTEFYNMYQEGRAPLPNEDEEREIYAGVKKILEDAGYYRYEISNFAKKGFECRHNLKYWNCLEYIGLGAAAHSYVNKKRFYNTGDLKKYMENPQNAAENIENLSSDDMEKEYIIMRFRLKDGIDKAEFSKRFGCDFSKKYSAENKKFIHGGFMKEDEKKVYLTDKGISVSNSILCEYI